MHERTTTVLTTSYNRANTLIRLYKSLQEQTNCDFLWLVIDDGSTDDTEEYINEIINTANFQIRYVKKENGGKHTAINFGIKLVETPMVFIVDSDDWLSSDAIETINNDFKKIKEDKYCGIVYYMQNGNGKYNTKNPVEGYFNYNDLRYKKKINGDLAEVWKTKCLIEYPFPFFEGEKFIGEAFIWSQMAEKYDVYVNKKILYYCEYLEGGLSRSGRRLRINNPRGGMAHANEFVKKNYPISLRIKNVILYDCYGFFSDLKLTRVLINANSSVLAFVFSPVAWMLYKYWKCRYIK